MFTQSSDGRMLTNRQLSRHLVGLWVTGHPTAMGLLKRIMPAGLLLYLDSKDQVPKDDIERLNIRDNLKLAQDHAQKNKKNPNWQVIEKPLKQMEKLVERHVELALQHWRSRMGIEKKEDKVRERPIVLRKRRERVKSEANWLLFYYKFNQNHSLPNLIWNHKTREELKEGLENEIRAFNVDRDIGSTCTISWNHAEFEIQYKCLAEEIKIGDYYLRLLLDHDDAGEGLETPIKRSYEFFNDLYHRFLLSPKVEMKCMCLQAMAIVYGKHSQEIGPFSDTKYIVAMLDRSCDRMERDRLVLFLNKLILHRQNVKDLMDAGGLRVLVDLLTLAHLHTSRAVVPTQTNVIEAGADMKRESEEEWYYGNAEKEQIGPVSFEKMKELWNANVLTPKTRCWAQGVVNGWRQLMWVPQLRWCLVAKGNAVMNESDLATCILNMLIQICQYYPSRDGDGAVIRPLPRAKQLLSEGTCLPHIVQLLLTFDPILVEKVATLLLEMSQDNPEMPRLFLTGVYYFILMYTGSNLLPIARFLQLTHTKQAFHADDTYAANNIMSRSILGQLLPEAMVSYLENHGAERFAEIFLGEHDTPEAIWSSEMRRLLIEKIACHLCDFTPRMQSNTRATYQYCAIPCVSYPQLENELFCGIYYLRHLCDIQRFPNWPIRDPVNLLKEVLMAWKEEVEKKPPSMSVDEAYEVLELSRGEMHDDSVVRKSYFRLAQKYHPDKNKDGREMFEKVNKAYDFICSRLSRSTEGPDPQKIVLILRTQSILFENYKEDLHPYKYAGYPMLIKTIQMETADETLFSKNAPLLAAASELAYHTVNCSALNAEELRREKGLEMLLEAFTRCVSVLSLSSRPGDVAVQVNTHITRCYTVAAQFQQCRDKIVEMPVLVRDLCRLLYYKHLPRLCAVATSCVSALAIDNILQMHLLQAGVLWHLLLFFFNYDYTLDEGGVEKSEETNQQEVANQLAKLAVYACARMAGYLPGDDASPSNAVVQAALDSLLTPYLAKQLRNNDPKEILKFLNSNTENPYLIWNNVTRAELTQYLEEQQQSKIRTGEQDPSFGSEFVFTVHSCELVIGGIFVRVYNEQPTFALEDAKGFTIELLDFLGSQAQYLHSLMMLSDLKQHQTPKEDRKGHIEMALEALSNVIKSNPGVEIQCIGHFKLLFSLMNIEGCDSIREIALEVIKSVTGNQECVSDIASVDVLVYLLLVLKSLPKCAVTALTILSALFSSTKLVKDAVGKGAVIYFLDLFCNSTNASAREKSAELVAKMCADKLVGPKVRILVGKFLPDIFTDAMRESPEGAVHMFEGVHENPELIWNDEARKKVSSVVKQLQAELYNQQRVNPDIPWRMQEDHEIVYTNIAGELVVGGVFLRLFVQNPSWGLRKPKEFLTELMNTSLTLMSHDPCDRETLDIVTNSLVNLLQAQPLLADSVPALGHIPPLFRTMTANNAVSKCCIQIVHQLCTSQACIEAMCHTDCIGPMKRAMTMRHDSVGTACEALNLMFSAQRDELIQQALKAELVQYLLSLLNGRLDALKNPAATKAQIVKALKAMSVSHNLGTQVDAILQQSSVWAEYRDQKHDLFITNTSTGGYLTGGVPAVAGYLTQGRTTVVHNIPPPMEHDDSFS